MKVKEVIEVEEIKVLNVLVGLFSTLNVSEVNYFFEGGGGIFFFFSENLTFHSFIIKTCIYEIFLRNLTTNICLHILIASETYCSLFMTGVYIYMASFSGV